MKIDLKQILNSNDIETLKRLVETYQKGMLNDVRLAYVNKTGSPDTFTLCPKFIFIVMAILNELETQNDN